MGWSLCGTDSEGREIGYGVEATCDKEGCDEKIDRGLAYACGGYHGGGEGFCDRYFCYGHLVYVVDSNLAMVSGQLCEECAEEYDEEVNDD